jgi:phosphoribosylanthranilate isomerase
MNEKHPAPGEDPMFVKICGITSEEDALLAIALGADALGFVFAPGSPRMVTRDEAQDIVKRLPHDEVLTFGVFRDERPERVTDIVNRVGLKGAQLHGREPAAEVAYVRQRVRFVIQGFAVGDPALEMAAESPADIVLVDAPNPGSGRVFDWVQVEGALDGVRLLLAGGLTPDNVADAIWRVRPWGVDVSTGVETAPGSGRKDPRKLRRFIEAARLADNVVAAETLGGNHPPPYDWQAEGA